MFEVVFFIESGFSFKIPSYSHKELERTERVMNGTGRVIKRTGMDWKEANELQSTWMLRSPSAVYLPSNLRCGNE